MKYGQNGKGKAVSVPVGLAWSAGVSVSLTLAGSIILAKLIDRENVAWESVGYYIMGILLISSFMGAFVAGKKIKHRILLISIYSGFVYYGILLGITALFFGGQYEAVGVTGLLIAGGSLTSALLTVNERGGRHRNKGRPTGKLNKKTWQVN